MVLFRIVLALPFLDFEPTSVFDGSYESQSKAPLCAYVQFKSVLSRIRNIFWVANVSDTHYLIGLLLSLIPSPKLFVIVNVAKKK